MIASAESSYTRALVEAGRLVELKGDRAIVEVRDPLQLGMVQQRTDEVAAAIRAVVDRPVRVEVRAASPTRAARPSPSGRAGDAALRRQAEQHPAVKRAIELFDARIVSVEPVGDDDDPAAGPKEKG